ncbi:SulP family inorganic anion transporter [Fuchsiella alkaliacetigena]|uniref:SulP family inorganic anion transporter n=1 Tax=Fuchsiella alkaliacetigena TaxID=957042 RepID=UPI00200AA2AA|nr:SulP family inorganic anion transporter [Fuchsiella alkaliacetigena]MCK8825579.1 SulP family inorganic anion transporter [Fuchsiella alkaliacetigena]
MNFIELIKSYQFKTFKSDLLAGLTVTAFALPQNMAYALIVGVNPIYGLYTSIVSMLVATVVGVSNYMVVAPTNMISVALASSLSNIASDQYLETLFLLTFLVGAIQIVLGILKLGDLVKYVSQSVIMALTTGVAFLIGAGQLGNLLGLADSGGSNLIAIIYNVFSNLQSTNYYALAIGLLAMLIIVVGKSFRPYLPWYLVAVIISTLIVYIFDLSDNLAVIQDFPTSLPSFNLVNFDLNSIQNLFSSALSIAILGFIQVLSIVKSLEKQSNEEVALNREFIGQGIVNFINAFFNGFAVSGSFTKSFANYSAGAKTRISQLIMSVTIILFILFLGTVANYIPISSLAALVIMVAYYMIDFKEMIRYFKTTRSDTIVFLGTLVTTLLTPRLDYAIYFGVIISVILVLKRTGNVNYSHMAYNQQGNNDFAQQQLTEVAEDDLIIINLAGSLHFNAADNLKNQLDESFSEDKIFIIRTRYIEDIDITSIQELEKFIDRVQSHGGEILLCGVEEEIFEVLKKSGLIAKLDQENIFWARNHIFSSTQEAVEEALSKTQEKNSQAD